MNKFNSIISSTSDDRSIIIWNVEPLAEQQNNTYDRWKYAKITPDYSLYAHKARVWKSIVMESGSVLSAGEVRTNIIFISHTNQSSFMSLSLNNIQMQCLGWSDMSENIFNDIPMGRESGFSDP